MRWFYVALLIAVSLWTHYESYSSGYTKAQQDCQVLVEISPGQFRPIQKDETIDMQPAYDNGYDDGFEAGKKSKS